jgi:hypothetical protein
MKRAVWIVLSLAAGACVFFYLRPQPVEPPKSALSPTAKQPLEDLAARDLKKLQDPQANQKDIDEALIRLSERQNAEARSRVLERASSPETERRVKAAMALGYLVDTNSVEKLTTLVNDPELEVRLAALRALSFRRSPERLQVLRKAMENDQASASEKILTMSALARAEGLSPAEAAARYSDRMFAALESDSENPETELLAFREIGSLAPQDERIQKKVIEILSKGPPSNNPKRVDLTFMALGFLNRSCPPNRASLVQAVLQREENPLLRGVALSQAIFLEKSVALSLLEKEALRHKGDKMKLLHIENLKKRLETTKAPDFCQPPKRPPPPPRRAPPARQK